MKIISLTAEAWPKLGHAIITNTATKINMNG